MLQNMASSGKEAFRRHPAIQTPKFTSVSGSESDDLEISSSSDEEDCAWHMDVNFLLGFSPVRL